MIIGIAWKNRTVIQYSNIGDSTYTISNSTGTYLIDGETETTLQFSANLFLGISLTDGIIVSLIGITSLATAIGVKVIDSGLSDFAQTIIFNVALYGGLWAIMSVFTYDLVATNSYGWILFLIISFIHLFGIMGESKQ